MNDWEKCVCTHTVRNLRAIFHAHEWPFQSNWKKAEILNMMLQNIHRTNWSTLLNQLDPSMMEALCTLINNPELPASDFLARFGPIRPYRPWRDDSPRYPWRNPISPAEELWYKGLIYRINDSFIIPDPVRSLIPRPPQSQYHAIHRPEPEQDAGNINVLADITLFLSLLHRKHIRLIHGRWLPPWALRELGPRLSRPLDFAKIRSERHCSPIYNLHYLASASGLCIPPRFSKEDTASPTCKLQLSAWEWLDADNAYRLKWLWDSWKEDLERSISLWSLFWPDERITISDHNNWLTYLTDHPSGTWNNINKVWTIPPPEPWFKLMTTFGAIFPSTKNPDIFYLTPLGAWLIDPKMSEPTWIETQWIIESHSVVTVPRSDASRSRLILEAFANIIEGNSNPHALHYQLSPQSLADGIRIGLNLNNLLNALVIETSEPLPKWVVEELTAWYSDLHAINIDRMTILTTDTPARMELLGREQPFRRSIRSTLSPRHVVIKPSEVQRLIRWLTQQGLPPYPSPTLNEEIGDIKPSIHHLEAHYLAFATYLNLSRIIELPVHLPARYLDEIATSLTDHERKKAEELAEEIIDRLKAWSREDFPPVMIPNVDEENYVKLLREAIERDHKIRIQYWAKGRENPNWRTVEPLRLEVTEDRKILVGYCHLAKDERHFRLDRIMKLKVMG